MISKTIWTEPLKQTCTLIIACFLLFVTPDGVAETGSVKNEALAIYKKKCSWCHGTEGKGDGPAAKFLYPPPRNFTLGLYKFVSTIPGEITLASDTDIFNAIANGLAGTAMSPWKGVLSDPEIWGLVSVLKGFTDIYTFETAREKIPVTERVPASDESRKKGRYLFRSAGCFECHGEEGRGDGSKRLRENSGERIWPRNLTKPWTFKGGKEPEDIFMRISAGIPGTPMPAFGMKKNSSRAGKALTEEERWHIINFLLSIQERSHKNKSGIIKARYTEGRLPSGINDKRWKGAEWTGFWLAPNVITGRKLFTPLNDMIKAKALFSKTGIALLLAWSDRSKSLPAAKLLKESGEEKIYEDAIAIQFPLKKGGTEGEKHYLGHGTSLNSVLTWYWTSGAGKGPQTTTIYRGNHVRTDPTDTGLYSKGVYENGQWRVLLKEETFHGFNKREQIKAGEYISLSFANWDGSNNERGSKHTFTSRGSIYLVPDKTWNVLLYPVALFALLLFIQLCIRERLMNAPPGRRF